MMDDDDDCGAVGAVIDKGKLKFHMTCHVLEPGPPRWEASD
jgi:hypothetical protein